MDVLPVSSEPRSESEDTHTKRNNYIKRFPSIWRTQKIAVVGHLTLDSRQTCLISRMHNTRVQILVKVADVVACCGTESVIREVTWGGSLHKEHVVRDIRLDANKQASCSPPSRCAAPACRVGSRVHPDHSLGTW